MPTTYQEIIVNAHGYSTKSRPNMIATHAAELLALANRAVRGLFAVAAHVNPEYWGTSANVNHDGAGWPRPANAQSVFKIRRTGDSKEVIVVPFDDPTAELSRLSVTFLGGKYRIAGSPLGPIAGDQLTIWYSRIPSKPAAITDVIDAAWEEVFDGFLTLEVAIYLALKDGRMDEVAALKPDQAKEAQLFVDFLTYANPTLASRYHQTRRVALPALMPLLAGGGAA